MVILFTIYLFTFTIKGCFFLLCTSVFYLERLSRCPVTLAWGMGLLPGLSPVCMIVEVQRSRGMQLNQLLAVAKVQSQVGGDDSFTDDLQHLLILTGGQVGENIVPFQLWETKRSIKKQKLFL